VRAAGDSATIASGRWSARPVRGRWQRVDRVGAVVSSAGARGRRQRDDRVGCGGQLGRCAAGARATNASGAVVSSAGARGRRQRDDGAGCGKRPIADAAPDATPTPRWTPLTTPDATRRLTLTP